MAADLGRRMLAENDELKSSYQALEQEHKEVIRVRLTHQPKVDDLIPVTDVYYQPNI